MTVLYEKPALNLRSLLSRIVGLEKRSGSQPSFQTFEFAGDGSTVAYEMAKGWKPLAVYDAGSRLKEATGAGFWSASFDGFLWTVTFGTAPTNLNVLLIDAWRPNQ